MSATQRIFLVGCPRSGTTIVQAAIAAHYKVTTFPESRFFRQAVQQYEARFGYDLEPPGSLGAGVFGSRWLRNQWSAQVDRHWPKAWAHPAATRCVAEFLAQVDRPKLMRLYPRFTPRLEPKIAGFIDILDHLLSERRRDMWLEKTPSHVLYLDIIDQHVPGSKFIHVIRHGPDVVASLADAVIRYDSWRSENPGLTGLDTMVELWNRCFLQSEKRKDRLNHHLVYYEEFLRDPAHVLRKVCHFLDLGFQRSMLLSKGVDLDRIAAQGPAKRNVAKGITAPEPKFAELFTPAEQDYIRTRLVAQDR